MRSAGAIRAGRAFVELFADDSRLAKGLKRAEYKLRQFGRRVSAMGRQMMALGAGLAVPLAVSVKAAGDAVETLNKFEAVFRDQADAAGDFADELADAVGRSRYELRDALASYQAFFVGLGFGAEEARRLSQEMERLSIDFASFYNIQDPDAVEKFQSGLAGMSRPLRQYGINLLDSAVQQKALQMGLVQTGRDLTQYQKVIARAAIITEAMTEQGAVGDAVRTAGSFQNRMKALRSRIAEAAVEIGNALIPAATRLVDKIVAAAQWTRDWAQRNEQVILSLAKLSGVLVGGGGLLVVLGQLSFSLSSIIGLVPSLVHGIHGINAALGYLAANPVGAVVAALGAATVGLAYALDRAQVQQARLNGEAAEALETGDRQRRQDQQRIRQLRELSEEQQLSAQQQQRAERIIAELESRYGDLGVAINGTTGAIEGMAEAQQRLNDAMRQAAVLELEAQVAELQNNLRELRREGREVAEAQQSFLGAATGGWGPGMSPERKLSEMERLRRAIEAEGKKLLAAHARLVALQEGDTTALAGEAGFEIGAPGGSEAGGAAAEDWGAKLHRLRLQRIEDEHDRRRALIMDERDRAVEAAQAEGKARADVYELMDFYGEKLAQNESARRRAQAREEEQLADMRMGLTDELTREEIRSAKQGVAQRVALLQQELKERIRAARAAGLGTDAVEQLERIYELRINAVTAAASAPQAATRVAFNVQAAGQWGGGGSELARIASSSEAMERLLQQIEYNTDQAETYT